MIPSSDGPAIEMPRYRCHKEVWGLKIAEIQSDPSDLRPTIDELEKLLAEAKGDSAINIEPSGEVRAISGATLVFEDKRYAPLRVDGDYIRKHNPQAGGYYVVYKDGYKSWSPAEAFEDGYTLIDRVDDDWAG